MPIRSRLRCLTSGMIARGRHGAVGARSGDRPCRCRGASCRCPASSTRSTDRRGDQLDLAPEEPALRVHVLHPHLQREQRGLAAAAQRAGLRDAEPDLHRLLRRRDSDSANASNIPPSKRTEHDREPRNIPDMVSSLRVQQCGSPHPRFPPLLRIPFSPHTLGQRPVCEPVRRLCGGWVFVKNARADAEMFLRIGEEYRRHVRSPQIERVLRRPVAAVPLHPADVVDVGAGTRRTIPTDPARSGSSSSRARAARCPSRGCSRARPSARRRGRRPRCRARPRSCGATPSPPPSRRRRGDGRCRACRAECDDVA